MYVKLKAVTAGHSLHELMKLVGKVRSMRSQASTSPSPDNRVCPPKKEQRKIGAKTIWLTMTLTPIERTLEA